MPQLDVCPASWPLVEAADEDDDLGWLLQVEGGDADDNPYDEFIKDVGALAMGATTYEWIQRHHPGEWFYEDRPTWVFTHRRLPPIAGADLHMTSEPVQDVHAAMVAAAGDRNVWLVGGGDLVGQFMDHDLLDEIWLTLTPVTLGAGAPRSPVGTLSQCAWSRRWPHAAARSRTCGTPCAEPIPPDEERPLPR